MKTQLVPILILSFLILSSARAANDGTVSLGIDPLYSATTEIKIEGNAAYVIAVSMYRARHMGSKNIVEQEDLITGENFSCRADKSGDKERYVCAARYNYEYKGELRPIDPAKLN